MNRCQCGRLILNCNRLIGKRSLKGSSWETILCESCSSRKLKPRLFNEEFDYNLNKDKARLND